MKRYEVISTDDMNEYPELETDDVEEAIKKAWFCDSCLTKYDRSHGSVVEIRDYDGSKYDELEGWDGWNIVDFEAITKIKALEDAGCSKSIIDEVKNGTRRCDLYRRDDMYHMLDALDCEIEDIITDRVDGVYLYGNLYVVVEV